MTDNSTNSPSNLCNPTRLGSPTLRNGNRRGDASSSPRCGAKTRSGRPCRAPAMWNARKGRYTRCRMHGGASTGPRTPEGRERSRMANWRTGAYSQAAKAEHRALRQFVRWDRLRTKQLARIWKQVLKRQRRAKLEDDPRGVQIAFLAPTTDAHPRQDGGTRGQ